MTPARTAVRVVCGVLIAVAAAHEVVLLLGRQYTLGRRIANHAALTDGSLLMLAASAACLIAGERPLTKPSSWTHDRALLFIGLLFVYLLNHQTLWSGDTLPLRYATVSLVTRGTLTLDGYTFLFTPGNYHPLPAGHPFTALDVTHGALPYYIRHVNGHYVSSYPVAASVLIAPFFALSALAGLPAYDPVFEVIEKFTAASLVAGSAVLLYVALLARTTKALAFGLTLVYGLCTTSLSVSSQALWQNAPSHLAVALALLALMRAEADRRWLVVLGFALGAAVLFRPTNVLVAAALGLYTLLRHGRSLLWLAPGFGTAAAFQLGYNVALLGHPLATAFGSAPGFWSTPLLEGLAGILFSPGRGLFVYSPVLAFAVAALLLSWRSGGDRLLRCLSLGVAATILLYGKWFMWWGGDSYGFRMLADLTPVLVFSLSALAQPLALSMAWRSLFVAACAWSLYAHLVGAFLFWGGGIPDVDLFPNRLWMWSTSPLVQAMLRVLKKLAAIG